MFTKSIKFSSAYIDAVIKNALNEDIGSGDVTTLSLIPESRRSTAVFIVKESCVIAGLPFAKRAFELVDPRVKFSMLHRDGERVKRGSIFARVSGRTGSILAAERVALNLLQRMSGIATMTAEYVKAVRRYKAEITDTRKTVPGLRFFDKYAVRAGGGRNHRFGLFDGILIKDNHIEAAGGVKMAVELMKKNSGRRFKTEVEATNISETKEALSAGADIIMLDNMTPAEMRKAVAVIRSENPKALIEASGGINLKNVQGVAATGVDLISIGALTHSVRAVDVSLEIR
ncbi:MAG: carboxylating nicotinate-nucleotide diphosphorylase [Nitrospirae bacterium]|nr:carboxylating nicotinate-nucleotide diphosphorylase [Nitrospirota bacterium]